MLTRRRNSPRQARFRVELKKLLGRGVPAAKAMKKAWAKVPKNPRKKSGAGVTVATRWCPTCQKHHIPISNGGRHRRNIGAGAGDRRRIRLNGPGTEIYGRVKAIEAIKGPESNYAGQLFRHDFNKPARIFGMPDGSLRIVPSGGR